MPAQGMTANELAPTSQVPTTMHHRALDVLGLNRSQRATAQRSLEIEVETYLNNSSTETDPLVFWQVCGYSKFLPILLMSLYH